MPAPRSDPLTRVIDELAPYAYELDGRAWMPIVEVKLANALHGSRFGTVRIDHVGELVDTWLREHMGPGPDASIPPTEITLHTRGAELL